MAMKTAGLRSGGSRGGSGVLTEPPFLAGYVINMYCERSRLYGTPFSKFSRALYAHSIISEPPLYNPRSTTATHSVVPFSESLEKNRQPV